MSGPPLSSGMAYYSLAVLFTVNLFNFIDRQIIFGVFPLVGKDLSLSDAQLGSLGSAFVILYMLASVPLGILGDRARRNRVIALGVGVWGAATFLSGLSRSYVQLFMSRTLVGIGEAAYGPVATAMVSDYFPKARRAFVNAVFTSAIPLGAALGVLLGGTVGTHFGWRSAFFVVGLPSLCLVPLAWRLPEPPRGASDLALMRDGPLAAGPIPRPEGSIRKEILGLFRIPTFVMVCVVGMLVAFATGAFAAWLPTYLHRVKRLPLVQAAAWYGGIQAFSGVLGVVVGGLVGDALMKHTRAGHLLTIGGGFLVSAPLGFLFLLHSDPRVFLTALFFAVFFLVLYTGTVNAVIHNVVHPNLRATAISIFVLLIHLGGDAFSPAIVGLISGQRSLQAAMLLLPVMVFFAGLLALAASGVVVGDMRRIEGRLAEAR
ncbi:MAG: MFS transporter [Candidatus Rokubacteria bacterium]|nr:MFS transporter [Candidatus Rokubacteria bacterium]